MSNIPQKPEPNSRGSERRRSARYRLSSPPEIEILQGDHGAQVQASLVDLSQGGCFVETECTLPLETELTIVLRKGDDRLRAQARVLRAIPNQGMALEFTAMEGESFRILDAWLSIFVATTWVAASRRRAQRAVMQIKVKISGYNLEGTRFTEDTHTVVVSAFGGLVILRTPVKRGQKLVLSNLQTKKTAECMVAHIEAKGTEWEVGLAFSALNQGFWPVDFPPADWSPKDTNAKRLGS